MQKNFNDRLLSFLSVIIFILAWQIIARLKIVDPVFIGQPLEILKESFNFFASGEIYEHIVASGVTFILGFSAAILFGVTLGLLTGINRTLYNIVSPYIFAIHSTPIVALFPLIIIWFGVGVKAKVVIIFLMTVVPILANTIDGARSMDASLIKMAKSFEAGKLFILRTIIFQASVPYILSGIRVATGRAIIGLIISEFYGYGKGIGYLVSFYGQTFQTDKLMALVMMLIIFSFSVLKTVNITEHRLLKWKQPGSEHI